MIYEACRISCYFALHFDLELVTALSVSKNGISVVSALDEWIEKNHNLIWSKEKECVAPFQFIDFNHEWAGKYRVSNL